MLESAPHPIEIVTITLYVKETRIINSNVNKQILHLLWSTHSATSKPIVCKKILSSTSVRFGFTFKQILIYIYN